MLLKILAGFPLELRAVFYDSGVPIEPCLVRKRKGSTSAHCPPTERQADVMQNTEEARDLFLAPSRIPRLWTRLRTPVSSYVNIGDRVGLNFKVSPS